MGHRGRSCTCTVVPCQQGNYPYGLTPSGDHSTICTRWFTPGVVPDWDTLQLGNNASITINGTSYTISQIGGSEAPQPYSLLLTTAPTVPWSLNFTTSGTCSQSGSTFTPSPAPTGWVAGAFAGHYVQLNSSVYAIVSNTTTSFTLGDSLPKKSFSIAFTDYQASGFTVSDDGVITFNVAPVGWFTNQLVGHAITIRDGNSTDQATGNITANTPTSMTLDSPLPTTAGGDFSVSGGVFTPATTPTGWYGGSTYTNGRQAAFRNKYLELRDASGTLQYRTTINYFSTTSLYLYSPLPPEGTYTGWTWKIVDPFSDWRWVISDTLLTYGSATPSAETPNAITFWTPSYNHYSTGWLGGEFTGCSITGFGEGVTILSNTTDTLYLSTNVPNTAPWILTGGSSSGLLGASGTATTCGAVVTSLGYADWTASMAGLSILIEGNPYTIASVQGTSTCTMTAAVVRDYPWYLTNYGGGQYWDIISPGFSTDKYSWQSSYPRVTSSTDGAEILWHSSLSIWQYSLYLQPTGGTNSGTPGVSGTGTVRFYFGPGGTCYFETPISGTSGTSRLVCGSTTISIPQQVNPSNSTLWQAPNVCVWKLGDNYHICGHPAIFSTGNNTYNLPLGLGCVVPASTWESATHQLGIGADSGATIGYLSWIETRGTSESPPTNCTMCYGSILESWTGSLPRAQVTIIGGPWAGTYICQYMYGLQGYNGTWYAGSDPHSCPDAPSTYYTGVDCSSVASHRDGTFDIRVLAGTSGLWGERMLTLTGIATNVGFPYTNISMPGPFACGVTAVSVSFL